MSGRIFILSGVSLLLLFVAGSAIAATPNYLPRDLRLGDEGLDVYNLQVILNSSAGTRVAESGPGSSGQESQVFGPKTEDAVRRFQAANASEVLSPAGLSSPTGFVGPRTRAALGRVGAAIGAKSAPAQSSLGATLSSGNAGSFGGSSIFATLGAALGGGPVSSSVAPTDVISESIARQNVANGAPVIFPSETLKVDRQEDSFLIGYGFASSTAYEIIDVETGRKFADATARTSNAIYFTPIATRSGAYKIYAKSKDGQPSNTVTVYLSSDSGPKIRRVTPDPLVLGEEMTIQGDNFDATGNSVITPFGRIDNVPSTRGKISIPANFGNPFAGIAGADVAGDVTVPITVRVVSAKGATAPFKIDVSF